MIQPVAIEALLTSPFIVNVKSDDQGEILISGSNNIIEIWGVFWYACSYHG